MKDSGVYEALEHDGKPISTGRGPLRATFVKGNRARPIPTGGRRYWRRIFDTQPND